MITAGLVLAGLAALLHVYIFWMESFAWTTPHVRRVFGLKEAQAHATRDLAFNQGFYNLFLAIAVFVGIGFIAAGQLEIGATLVFAGAASMAAASVVLLFSGPNRVRAAAIQGVLPALGVLLLALGLVL